MLARLAGLAVLSRDYCLVGELGGGHILSASLSLVLMVGETAGSGIRVGIGRRRHRHTTRTPRLK